MRILIFFLLLIATTADAGTYWAAPGGNDAGACTSSVSDPGVYLTIGRAAECATVAPWTINMKGNLGNYTQTTHLINTQTRHASTFVSGSSAGSPNIIQTKPGDTRAVITAGSGNGWVLIYQVAGQRNNITFRDFVTDGLNATTQGLYLTGSNLTVEDCEVKNNQDFSIFSLAEIGSAGSYTFPWSTHIIRRCKLHDNVGGGITSQGSYAWYGSPKNSIFEDNEVYNVTAAGIQLQYDNDLNIVRRNYFHHIKFQTSGGTCNGITNSVRYNASGSTNTGNAQIYNNIIDLRSCVGGPSGQGTYGIQQHQSTGVLMANNLIMGGINNVYFVFGISANAQLTNNILLASSGPRIIIEPGTAVGTTYTASYSACESGANCATSSNGTISNKQTIAAITDCSVSASDYHHKTGLTNCKDHGTTVSAATSDFDQVARPQNGVYDIGPYEFPTSTPTAPAPPTGVTIS